MKTSRGRIKPVFAAFTLIELLVVISIVAILIAMLIPALGKAKSLALRVTCGSVMRQAGISWSIYLSDFKETLPLMRGDLTGYSFRLMNGGSDPAQTYFTDVFPVKVRQCPTYNSRNQGADTGFDWGYALIFQSNYYAAAGFMDDRADNPEDARFVKIRQGLAREKTTGAWYSWEYDPTNDIFPLVTDFLQESTDDYSIVAHAGRSKQGYIGANNVIPSEGANSLWKDGHVEWHDWPCPTRPPTGPDIYMNYPYEVPRGADTLPNGKRNGWTWPGNMYFRPYFWMKGDNGK